MLIQIQPIRINFCLNLDPIIEWVHFFKVQIIFFYLEYIFKVFIFTQLICIQPNLVPDWFVFASVPPLS